ncbi:hypothetical protein ABBQ38_007802 [Trebouxia sp. C0009 RCD-2024]
MRLRIVSYQLAWVYLQCELHGVGFHWSSKHCCALAPESAQKGFATGFMISRVSQCNASAGPLDILALDCFEEPGKHPVITTVGNTDVKVRAKPAARS